MKARISILVLAASCVLAPLDVVHFVPPDRYRAIWAQAEECTGETGRYGRVRWHLVPGRSFIAPSGERAIGLWVPPHDIYIAGDWVNAEWVVKHEMVHDLTRLSHDGGERDIRVWGIQCEAMWGYQQSPDTNYIP